jgi:outer membrane biosynthesis protein TonB
MVSKRNVVLVVAILLVGVLAIACAGPARPTSLPVTEEPQPTQIVVSATDTPTAAMPTDTPPPPPPPEDTPTPAPSDTPAPAPTPAETNLPVTQIVAPTANTQFTAGQQVTLHAITGDDTGVVKIEFYVDGNYIQEALAPQGMVPPSLQADFTWQATTPGSHTLSARGVDPSGNNGEFANVAIQVAANVSKPQVVIDSPASGMSVQAGQQVILHGTAIDEVGITKIELWADNAMFTYVPSAQPNGQSPMDVSISWRTNALGSHTLFMRAFDHLGQWSDSTPITIVVVDNSAPSISVQANKDHVQIGDTVKVKTNAVDAKGITKIELWADGRIYNIQASQNPNQQQTMSVEQKWKADYEGKHSLQVKVYDTAGQVQSSQVMQVKVTNAPPPPPTMTPTALPPPPPPPTTTPTVAPPPPPPPPQVSEILDPPSGFEITTGNPLNIRVHAAAPAGLVRVEVWGFDRIGQQTPDLWASQTLSGIDDETVTLTWAPSAPGSVSFFARAIDVNQQYKDSTTVHGIIDVMPQPTDIPEPPPPPPTDTPEPMPTDTPEPPPPPTDTPEPMPTDTPVPPPPTDTPEPPPTDTPVPPPTDTPEPPPPPPPTWAPEPDDDDLTQ